jgi:hypothetical protein
MQFECDFCQRSSRRRQDECVSDSDIAEQLLADAAWLRALALTLKAREPSRAAS